MDQITANELMNEKLSSGASIDDYIKDFETSNAPPLRGKSKEKRRQMALEAYYANK